MKLFNRRTIPNGPTVKRVIYRSGVTRDGRNISNSDVIAAYKNTTQYILPQQIEIPLKYGHEDNSQEYKGEIISVRLQKIRKKNTKTYRYQIVAEIRTTQATYDLLQASAFTGLSAEIATEGFEPDGNEYGQHIAGLALLGTEPAAIPGLLSARFQDEPDSIYYYSFVPGSIKYKKTETQEEPMETEKFQVPADVMTAMETLTTFIASLSETEETEPEPEETEDNSTKDEQPVDNFEADELRKKDEKIEELEAELAEKGKEKEVDEKFSMFHKAGKVTASDKSIFYALAKHAGIEVAVKEYSAKTTRKTPPMNPIATTELSKETNSDNGWMKYKPKWEKHFSKIMSKENEPQEFAAFVRNGAEKEYAKNGGKK